MPELEPAESPRTTLGPVVTIGAFSNLPHRGYEPAVKESPMASEKTGENSTVWLARLTHLLYAVRSAATILVLGLATLSVSKTLMHARRLASSTVEKMNTGAQATAVVIGLLCTQQVAAHFAPVCAILPMLSQLLMHLLPGQQLVEPKPLEFTPTGTTPTSFADQAFDEMDRLKDTGDAAMLRGTLRQLIEAAQQTM